MALSGWAIFIIFFIFTLILAGAGWVLYSRYRANKLGLPPPSLNPFSRSSRRTDPTAYRPPAPAPGGIQGWISDKWNSIRNVRTAGGAYESTGYGGGSSTGAGGSAGGRAAGRSGLGPLDPDEAWDARVDHEMGTYYEEPEVGLHDASAGPYGGGGYGQSMPRQEVDARYDEEVRAGRAGRVAANNASASDGAGAVGGSRSNPFGDNAEPSNMSLRGISPRPEPRDDSPRRPGYGHKRGASSLTAGSIDTSPIERKSMFRENM